MDAQFQRDPCTTVASCCVRKRTQTAIANVNFDTARATEPGAYQRKTCLESTRRSLCRFSILKGPKIALPG